MLEGIHVLNKISETTNAKWGDWTAIIITLVGLILGIILGLILKYRAIEVLMAGFIVGILGFVLGAIVLAISGQFRVPTGEYTYQVTIDKNVSMTEFNDKYDIIKQEGEIYYIREKEGE